MTNKIQSIRGMQDILADATPQWQYIEKLIQAVLGRYGYREIRLPILEKTELFERSIGEMTDIVSKEMYTFTDHNGDRLTLRPEGTAGCVRAGLQHSLFYNAIQRLWYMGPMFRHERPQKGRLRQFHQIGVEVFGLDGPDIDAEIIIMCSRIWTEIGLGNLCLQINTLGTTHSRQRYREVLVEYFTDHQDKLDEDSQKRLKRNPLRILDSNNPEMQNLIDSAPRLDDYLDNESQEHFAGLSELLTAAKIDYVVNPRLVRGLDYYCKTVFEWITDQLGAQGTVCAGGRYDGLLEHFGGKATAAIGFALGLERLIALVDNSNINNDNSTPHVYFIVAGEKAKPTAIKLAEMVRDELPNCRLIMHCGGGSFKSQFKKADKSGADIAVILGDDELEKETTTIKQLRQDHEQIEVPWGELCNRINLLVDL